MVFGFLKTGYQKLTNAFQSAGAKLGGKISDLVKGKIDEDVLDELEQLLYEADLGVKTTTELVDGIRKNHRNNPNAKPDQVIEEIRSHLLSILKSPEAPKELSSPHIILIVGVNGNGKTTTIAKLAKLYKEQGKKVLLGAADTFRAAAIDQLEMWANKVGVDIVKGQPQADPAAVAFDTVTAAKARGADVVLIDTAGRLHTKTDLMKELEKIRRSCSKVTEGAPQETLLVLDATTGQNAVDQAKTFHNYTPISGLALTKLDGTAKGGIVVAIQREIGVPVQYIGVGEGMDDLQPFAPEAFIEALL